MLASLPRSLRFAYIARKFLILVPRGKRYIAIRTLRYGEPKLAITIESVESVSMVSVWMLEPRIPELLLELRKRGYATARVRPRSLGGYDVTFIEPNVVAIKGSTYVAYNPGRRSIAIEGPNPDELLKVLNEVEEVLKYVGSDPVKAFYSTNSRRRLGLSVADGFRRRL